MTSRVSGLLPWLRARSGAPSPAARRCSCALARDFADPDWFPSTSIRACPVHGDEAHPPADRPVCKRCGGKWDGGPELLCEAHAEQYRDFWNEVER